MNIGRGEINFFSHLINKLSGSYRYLTNFNFIKKSKMNVSHHYDISDDLIYKSKENYTLKHFQERINIYNEEEFDYEIHNINLKD